ncbi:aminoacetone oxidase family FAD-binding enzyme [Hymenobacter amundsenii]|uniref:Aminoacetone oxidase family FAD-binding enzyme n=2 Tax=Hymenobacter amundsenii TaxID=2006685 RepID=A0A246FJ65_9BACT|nr:aminoacetone oxidase family FAD-binding enzyme [Hymenobacter amundsenii]
MTVAVLGGGAAGFFGAIACAEGNPGLRVVLIEKTGKLLSKVRISGGGRCNVTHAADTPAQLVQHYPRGARQLKQPFQEFGAVDTVRWFANRGVTLKTEPDGRMFPITDSSETVAQCLLDAARRAGVEIMTQTTAERIELLAEGGFELTLSGTHAQSLPVARLLVATGGAPKTAQYDWLRQLGHSVQEPVPSLFTFNVPNSPLKELPGVSVPRARVRVAGEKLEYEGPVLVTHWGLSGPAVLKLSAWGARRLHDLGYQSTALVNWIPDFTEDTLRQHLQDHRGPHGRKTVVSNPLFGLPQRLWRTLAEQAGIGAETRWNELPAKLQNRLIEALLRTALPMKGKTTYKDEFVTCGGISLAEINMQTLESRLVPGLHFAGEVLDIDGITGGFNFQAAWTTGFLAGRAMSQVRAVK